MTGGPRPRGLLGLLGVLGLALTLFAATPALAASYRYWSFWDGTGGTWAYATQGPSTARPADGTVLGFRFAVSKDAGDEAAKPRAAADFDAACAGTAPAAGKKRIGIVVDFGLPAEAPGGETPPQEAPRTACAQVAPEATAAEALAEVAKPLRYNGAALLCGISGYPRTGCGEPIADAEPKPPASASAPAAPEAESDSGSENSSLPSAGLFLGIAALLALGSATVWQSRRRKR
ncbi:SCO2322 family protein [Streptomyces sp. NBC_00249]|uniref:SCO2322 family protein n=1 Tax=Streptomyces sp. NBC_00249 TaxID=2975690 RepID=UPI00225375BF|nr:SCO2322 family protein [Streptomyces sp. NBC_00249]MCX5197034.1 SCO2322 family protein [Streptomyces sp. NBC_00249]